MQAPYTTFKDSNATLTAAGTRQQLSTVSVPCAKIFITAGRNNQGILVMGGPTVVAADSGTSGNDLTGGQSMNIEIDDLSKVWYDGTSTGDKINYSSLF